MIKVIDSHTHIFPDSLAQKAKATLTKNINYLFEPYTDFTRQGLIDKMDEWDISMSVVHPVITKPSQLKNTNLWAQSINSDRLLSFGAIFPHTDNYKQDIDFVKSLGLIGLKFHAEYQDFIPDSPHMLKIYDYAFEQGLIIMHHAGHDIGMPPPYKSSPAIFANMIDHMQGGTFILAHLGGHEQWDDVPKYLSNKNVYLDTSMGFFYYSERQFKNVLHSIGEDRILFASDSPWSNAHDEILKLKKIVTDKKVLDKILYKNAAALFRIKNDDTNSSCDEKI